MKNKTAKSNFFTKIKFDYITISVVLLLIIVCINFVRFIFSPSFYNSGEFEILSQNQQAPVFVTPVSPVGMNLKGKEAVLELRKNQLDQLSESGLFQLTPDGSIFSGVDENLPWTSVVDNNIIQSLYDQGLLYGLLNPLLLVSPQLTLNSSVAPTIRNVSKPWYLKEIVYNSELKEARGTFVLSSYLFTRSEVTQSGLDILTSNFNAFDLGFKFIQVDPARSSNLEVVSITGEADEPSAIFSSFSQQLCKAAESEKSEAENCNQLGSSSGGYKITIKSLPASVSFKLWKNQPEAGSDPTMNFILNFESAY